MPLREPDGDSGHAMPEDSPDPGIAVECPRCRAPLRYVATKPGTDVYLYVCAQYGL